MTPDYSSIPIQNLKSVQARHFGAISHSSSVKLSFLPLLSDEIEPKLVGWLSESPNDISASSSLLVKGISEARYSAKLLSKAHDIHSGDSYKKFLGSSLVPGSRRSVVNN